MKIAKVALGVLVTAATTQAAVVLVDDRFIDGGADNGADVKDVNWQLYTSGPTLTVLSDTTTGPNEGSADNNLNINPGSNGFRGVYGILGSTTTLAIGDKLTLTYDMAFQGSPGDALAAVRYGIYNSGGTNDAANDKGYMVRASSGTGTPPIEAWYEPGTNGTVLGGSDLFVIPGGSGSGYTPFTATSTNMGITLTRTGASSIKVELTQNSNIVWTATDTSATIFAFDEIAIGTGGVPAPVPQYRIDNITLTYTAVPEPATLGLLAGAGFALGRRRRS